MKKNRDNRTVDVAVIGCGIVGAAVAYELSQYMLKVAVLEKENDVANATSKANSGILHAGYDPEPGTLMAKLNVEGSKLAAKLCKQLRVPYRQCGSLVLAFSSEELQTLHALFARGIENGVLGLEVWDQATVRQREPQLSAEVLGALYAPTAAVVSPWEYTLALAETAVKNGAEIHLSTAVTAIEVGEAGYRIHTDQGEIHAQYVINAAGVYADEIHNMVAEPAFSIQPDRGEYYLLDKTAGSCVEHVVFQCPSKVGKGVLVAPTAHGNLIVGPSSVQQKSREDVATTLDGLGAVAELSRKSVPGLSFRDNIRNFSGIRANSDQEDFVVAQAAPNFIDLACIKSPGLTAAPAIAKMAMSLLQEAGLALTPKLRFVQKPRPIPFNQMTLEEKQALIKKDPSYGRVICRCETITEGEIREALRSPIPPRSVDAVKRRCNTGMGRCQGGFCGPRVVELLAEHFGVSPLEIQQDKTGSWILCGTTKADRGCQA